MSRSGAGSMDEEHLLVQSPREQDCLQFRKVHGLEEHCMFESDTPSRYQQMIVLPCRPKLEGSLSFTHTGLVTLYKYGA